jgi:hypothetical protein
VIKPEVIEISALQYVVVFVVVKAEIAITEIE